MYSPEPIFGTSTSVTLPLISFNVVASLNVPVPSVKLLALITMVPPWTTSTSVDLSKRNLTNSFEIVSIFKFCTSLGKAVFPSALKETVVVFELSFTKALYDFIAKVYEPS